MKIRRRLAVAKKQGKRQYIRLAISAVTISLSCMGVIFLLNYYQRNNTIIDPVAPSPPQQIEHTTAVKQSGSQSAEALRQSYLEGINEYENSIKPELQKIELDRWDSARHSRLIALEEQVLAEFALGNYAVALDSLQALKRFAREIIDDSVQQFSAAFSSAQTEYQADNYADARRYIDRALMLDKGSVEAGTLEGKIERLVGILPLLKDAQVAMIENQAEKELGIVEQIIRLAPQRESAVQRRKILRDAIREKNFRFNVAQSYQAIAQGKVEKAMQGLNAARNIAPHAQEVKDLTTVFNRLKREQRINLSQQATQTAMAGDDWEEAGKQLDLILQEQPADQGVQESIARVKKIIALQDDLQQYIVNPYQLSEPRNMVKAQEKIAATSVFLAVSPSLREKTEVLEGLLEATNRDVSVQIISDNKTDISVRSVGIVGMISSKIIHLKPGRYQFEGKRQGFKSKLIDVLLPYDKSDYRLTIICDEAI